MYELFERAFRRDDEAIPFLPSKASESGECAELLDRFEGQSFNRALYRLVHSAEVPAWNERVTEAFPVATGRIFCFGFDWLGRVFALDSRRREATRLGVTMFEPGTGEVLEIPANIETFHDQELLTYADAALAVDFHTRWLASGGGQPRRFQCVGYKKPLFLGGVDAVENLELGDLDVYWSMSSQLITATRGLPIGQAIGNIKIG